MRINHNIASLNTYGRLTNNNANSAKSLEKLSSGLRINRAGDDAAGLAISEKMRSQIRGLDQAGRNAQDGISLIQTAEGALTETHSILQRMRELAVQAANDTNTDSDRAEIQKEINQLTSEINRIGNTTEFNTQKVLNGGTAMVPVTVTATTPPAFDTAIGAIGAVSSTPGVAATPATPDTPGVQGYTEFKITTALVDGETITVGGQTITTYADAAARSAANAGAGDAYGILATDTAANQAAAIRGMTFADLTASGAGTTVRLTQTVAGTGDVAEATANVTVGGGAVGNTSQNAGTAADPGVKGTITFEITTALTTGNTITVGGKTITTYADAAARTAAGDAYGILATDDAAAQAADIAAMAFDDFDVDDDGFGTVTLTQSVAGTGTIANATINADPAGAIDVANTAGSAGTPAVPGYTEFKITTVLEAGDTIEVGGKTITVYADATAKGADAYGIDLTAATDADSQAAAIRAMFASDPELVASGTGAVVRLTQISQGTGDVTAANPTIGGTSSGAVGDITQSNGTAEVPGVKGTITFEITTALTTGNTITVGGKTITTYADATARTAAGDAYGILATDDAAAQAADIAAMAFDDFDVADDGSGTVTLTQSVAGTGTIANATINADPAGAIDPSHVDGSAAVLAVPGYTEFEITAPLTAGDTLVVGGKTITVYEDDAALTAASDAFGISLESAADANAQAAAVRAMFASDPELSATGTGAVVRLTQIAQGTGDVSTVDTSGIASPGGAIGNIDQQDGTALIPGDPADPGTQGTTTFTVTTALGAGDTFTVGGKTITVYEDDAALAAANAGAGDAFGISLESAATIADQADAIRTIFNDPANAALGLTASGTAGQVTLSQTVNGTGDVTAATAVTNDTDLPGVYEFSTATAVAAGGSYRIDGHEIRVIDAVDAASYTAELAAGTAILAGSDAAEQRTNLVAAINLNADLAGYTAAISGTTPANIELTQVTASATAPVVSTSPQAGATGSFSVVLQIGSNQSQNINISIRDMRAQTLGVAGLTASSIAAGFDGNVSDARYSSGAANQLTDVSTTGTLEYGLDVSTFAKASAAITVVDQAITQVSAERSKLGAYQNRLEHTINNLGASSENLTAAESRIRDVDMAKEMMEFTKNNILAQAAQAMLAQANQQPQGVLQLLR